MTDSSLPGDGRDQGQRRPVADAASGDAATSGDSRAAAPTPTAADGSDDSDGSGAVDRPTGVRRGVRIGVDVGDARVGVAICDPEGILATPVVTLRRGRRDLRDLAALVTEHGATEVVVGLPRSLSGHDGPSAVKARAYARRLATLIAPVPVREVDERLTTVSATRDLRASGVRGRRTREVVDQAAAVVILQSALDTERTSGRPPGRIVQAEA